MPKKRKQDGPARPVHSYDERDRVPAEVEREVDAHLGMEEKRLRLHLYASGGFIFEHTKSSEYRWSKESGSLVYDHIKVSVPVDWVERYFNTGLWRGIWPDEEGRYAAKLFKNCLVCFSGEQWTDEQDGAHLLRAPFCWFFGYLDKYMVLKRMTLGLNRFGATWVMPSIHAQILKELAQQEALKMLGVKP